MPAKRIAMRHVREGLRLKTAGVSGNEIARRLNVASSTVRLTLQRLAAAGLHWPLPAEMTDTALEAQLFAAVDKKQGHRRCTEPDWATLHRELKRKHVTLQILWDEYIEQHPDGYRYSRFCELYRGWASRLSVTMRQSHAGGEKMFVDYAGYTVPVIVDRLTGKTRPAQIFVAALGASNFTYAEAAGVVRHQQVGNPADRLKGPGMGDDPISEGLGNSLFVSLELSRARWLDHMSA
jgi:transposase